MKKQLWLHIGFPKTGTTSIQVWMIRNAGLLAAHGVLYPMAGRGEGCSDFGHHRFPRILADAPISALEESWPDMAALLREIHDSPAAKVVISSEDFSIRIFDGHIDLLARRLVDFDVKIVCYVRRQDEFITSVWSTAVCHFGEASPLSECLSHPWLDYLGVIDRWARIFGRHAVILRVFEESQLQQGDAVADFLSICGIDVPSSDGEFYNERVNKTVQPHIASILRYCNAQNAEPATIARFRDLSGLLDRNLAPLQLLTRRERAALLERHASGNSSLARTYLGRADGILFETTVSDEPPERDLGREPSGIARALGIFAEDVYAALTSHAEKAKIRPDFMDLPDIFRNLPDDGWLDVLLQTTVQPEVQGFHFPRYPDTRVQETFVGSSSGQAIQEAFSFYLITKGYAAALGAPISADSRFLDFGVGWGRFPRIFWKDIPALNLFGCDVDPDILAICSATGVPGSYDRIYQHGRLPYPDGFFSSGIAYSVFTHLSLEAHLHWMEELARVLCPGAIFCMTLEPRHFIDFLEEIPPNPPSNWLAALKKYACEAPAFRRQYDDGDFVYLPTGGGIYRQAADYGDAIVPPSFIEREWAHKFALRAYIDNASQCPEAIAIVQRL
jgi:hypothetical protein